MTSMLSLSSLCQCSLSLLSPGCASVAFQNAFSFLVMRLNLLQMANLYDLCPAELLTAARQGAFCSPAYVQAGYMEPSFDYMFRQDC